MGRLRGAIRFAGFRTISAQALDQAVAIDYELKNDIAASAFQRRLITPNLNDDAAPDGSVLELTNLFSRGSELAHAFDFLPM